jgi:hypothetical protein
VLKAEAAFTEAKMTNDVAALDRLMADDFVEINQWGQGKRDKQEMIALFRSYHTLSLTPSRVSVRVFGGVGVVDGVMEESGTWTYAFLRTWVLRESGWQLVSCAHIFPVDPSTMRVIGQPTRAPRAGVTR